MGNCSVCGKSLGRLYYYCDQALDDAWCAECFTTTPCGKGKHGEGCATKVIENKDMSQIDDDIDKWLKERK
jgi:hypothetical protein